MLIPILLQELLLLPRPRLQLQQPVPCLAQQLLQPTRQVRAFGLV
jgi:hypothetical protein